jgi:hypothetical protein
MKKERLLELAGLGFDDFEAKVELEETVTGLSADEVAALKDAVLNTYQELSGSAEDEDAAILKQAAQKAKLW